MSIKITQDLSSESDSNNYDKEIDPSHLMTSRKRHVPKSSLPYERKLPVKLLEDERFSFWIQKSRRNENKAFCKPCNCEIAGSITHIERHSKTEKHKQNVNSAYGNTVKHQQNMNSTDGKTEKHKHNVNLTDQSSKVTDFLQLHKSSLYLNQVEAAEMKLRTFIAKHNLPISLLDHLPGVIANVCPDSQVAKDIKCARINRTSIFCDVTEDVEELSHDIADVFKVDLSRMLAKNVALFQSIRNNPEFTRGDEGISRLTRLLVGQLAQQYLTEYCIDSWKSGRGSSSKNIVASRLDVLEEVFEKSIAEMKRIKSQLEDCHDYQMFGVPAVLIFKDS